MMRIVTLVENTALRPELEAEHGLSLFIETNGRRLRFDMGQSPAFARNAARLGVDLGTVDTAILSHGHYDHVGAVAALRKATGCKVYMDPVDAAGNQMLPLTRDLVDENWPANGELKIDELTFKIYHTPGHTPGSVCLLCGELLFSGDTLFSGSCGRTDFPGGSMQQMQQSLSLLAELPIPDTVQVLPGHESFSTLGRERRSNPYMNGAWF